MTEIDAYELWQWLKQQWRETSAEMRHADSIEVRRYREGLADGYSAVIDHIRPDLTQGLCAALVSDLTRLAEDEDTPVDDVAGLRAAARLVTEWAATKAKPS